MSAVGIVVAILVVAGVVYLLSYSGGGSGKPNTSTSALLQAINYTGAIQGAGATFPQPFYSNLSAQFNLIVPRIQINYNGIGSGGGIKAFTNLTVDFGASDAPMTDSQRQAVPSLPVHVPMVIGGIVAAYSLPGVNTGLVFTGDLLAKIYLGQVYSWNDPSIQALNPGVTLPSHNITVVHRSDGSGTTYAWTQYLSASNANWASQVGSSTSVNWPLTTSSGGGSGNAGVAALLDSSHAYSIGYVEYTYATLNNLTYGYIKNAAGTVVQPTVSSFSAAVSAAASVLPAGNQTWSQVSIINAVANNATESTAYPVTTFTYVLLYQDLGTVPGMTYDKAYALVAFLWWAIHDGQLYAPQLHYVPLPSSVVTHDETTLHAITFNGKALIP
jgi:phosphate transport system substrate-binding protein